MQSINRASSHAQEQKSVVFCNDLPQSSHRREAADEVYPAWDRNAAYNELFGDVPFDDNDAAQALFDVLVLHSRGHFDKAYAAAEQLLEHGDSVIALTARSVHLQSALIRGDAESAYEDSLVLKDACGRGLKQCDDKRLYGSSIICGMYLELTLRASLFDLPSIDGLVEVIPPRLCAYYGYVLALREMMCGNYELAKGIAYMLHILVGSHMHNARCYLYLVYAQSHVALGDTHAAVEAFKEAWSIHEQYGVIAPFIGAYTEYFGLHRACVKEQYQDKYLKMEALANSYRKSSNALCAKWGMSSPAFSLSSFECCVWMLVLLGWRNKEIAAFIKVTENTVKHQLTSIYQKMGVKNRQQLRERLKQDRPSTGKG